MSTDIRQKNFNSSTVDVVAVQGTMQAVDREGNSNAAGEYIFGSIPKGAIILAVYLNITKAFNGTSPTLAVGVTGTAEKFLPANALGVATIVKGDTGLDAIQAVSEDLMFTLASSDNTEGEATVYIEYIDTAARREIFTV